VKLRTFNDWAGLSIKKIKQAVGFAQEADNDKKNNPIINLTENYIAIHGSVTELTK